MVTGSSHQKWTITTKSCIICQVNIVLILLIELERLRTFLKEDKMKQQGLGTKCESMATLQSLVSP